MNPTEKIESILTELDNSLSNDSLRIPTDVIPLIRSALIKSYNVGLDDALRSAIADVEYNHRDVPFARIESNSILKLKIPVPGVDVDVLDQAKKALDKAKNGI